MNFLRHIFTGIDNTTYDIGRVLLGMAVTTAVMLTIYVVVFRATAFDIQAFGLGISSLLFGGGGMLLMKKDTEPKKPEN